jgi:nucleolar protein 12
MLFIPKKKIRRHEYPHVGKSMVTPIAASTLDVGLGAEAASGLPSIDDFFGSGPAHQRPAAVPAAVVDAKPKKKLLPRCRAVQGAAGGEDSAGSKKRGRGGVLASTADGDGKEDVMRDAGDDTRRGAAPADGEGGKDPCDAGDDKMERTIFVGGVPLAEDGRLINPKTIKTFFRDCGEIESVRLRSLPVENPALPKKASIAMGKIDGRRETCNAYVVFKSKESVPAAVRKDGAAFGDEGHRIRVDEARPPGEGGRVHKVRLSVFVGNVPFHAEEEQLRRHFEKCGEITNLRIVRDPKTLVGKGFAYVTFTDCDAVSDAMELNGSKLLKREIRVTRCKGKPTPAQLGGAGGARAVSKAGAGNHRMAAEFRRRKQRLDKRTGKQEASKDKAPRVGKGGGKPGTGKANKEAKLKKMLKVKQAPKFKNRKRDKGANNGKKGSAVTKSEKRRDKVKKDIKKAKKASKGKQRKV